MANAMVVVRDAAGYARVATAADTLCDGTGQPMNSGSGPSGPVDWTDLTGKPATFPPDVHTHLGIPATVTLGADHATLTSITLANITGLSFAVAATTCYDFRFTVLFRSAATTTGIRLAVTCPASPDAFAYSVETPVAADGAAGQFAGQGTTSGDAVVGTGVQAANTVYLAVITGILRTGATAGTLQVQAATEIANSGVIIKAYSGGTLTAR